MKLGFWGVAVRGVCYSEISSQPFDEIERLRLHGLDLAQAGKKFPGPGLGCGLGRGVRNASRPRRRCGYARGA